MPGRYPQRHGHDYQPGRNDGLALAEPTIADALKGGGYATGIVGKWNLGARDEFHPQRRGFDEFPEPQGNSCA
jgi:arylsulfatase A-like enzyme